MFNEKDHPREPKGSSTGGQFTKKEYSAMSTDELKQVAVKEYRQNTPYEELTKNKGINIIIDEKTPCLRRLSDGAIVKTAIERIDTAQYDFTAWEFNWHDVELKKFEIYALRVVGDERIQGLVALRPLFKDYYAVEVKLVEAAPFNNKHNKNNKKKKKEFNGVGGHLFAEAVRQSFQYGFSGFVFMKVKSSLNRHYKKTLGAQDLNKSERTMYIGHNAAKELYEKYYGNNE